MAVVKKEVVTTVVARVESAKVEMVKMVKARYRALQDYFHLSVKRPTNWC